MSNQPPRHTWPTRCQRCDEPLQTDTHTNAGGDPAKALQSVRCWCRTCGLEALVWSRDFSERAQPEE
jgi:RNase P subunit RPR2